ncbi:DUF488 domain-containing protein [Calidifontibacter terrae]
MTTWQVKNVRDQQEPGDGERILVDRLWPRGVSKEAAALNHWAKDVAPTTVLRRWFHQGPGDFCEFTARYLAELNQNAAAGQLRADHDGSVTLLTATADRDHNHALVLRAWLDGQG